MSAISNRIELVPQSIAATQMNGHWRLLRHYYARAARPPRADRGEGLAPERVTPGRGELMRDQGVQALDAVRHAARRLGTRRQRLDPGVQRRARPPPARQR